jgi:predicted peptidase
MPVFKRIVIGCLLLFCGLGYSQARIELATYHAALLEDINYFLYYPKGYEQTGSEKFPLLLFLHGGGESGLDLEGIKQFGPPSLLTEGLNIPMLILAPQHPHAKQLWNVHAVKQLLDYVALHNRVDPSRIYLTGLSRGGFACWELALNYPETFAAMAVVCGMSPKPYASWLNKQMGIWLFHGTHDPVIPFEESRQMTDRLRQLGYDVTFTTYKEQGHEIWNRAYSTPELFRWFLSFSLALQ